MAIDLEDKSIIEDRTELERAEHDAKTKKYGSLDPSLVERLETMQPDDVVDIVIWVAGEPERSRDELYATLADLYPEAQEAVNKGGKPFDVDDYDLMMEIKRKYLGLIAEDYRKIVESTVAHLEAKEYEVVTVDGIPNIFTKMSKSSILEMSTESLVGVFYLAEGKTKPEMDIVLSSDRVESVWENGFDGTGISIAILEVGKVNFDDYLNPHYVRSCSES